MDHYKAFLRAWLDFAENPAKNPVGFDKRYGLCTSLWDYGASTGLPTAMEYKLDSKLAERLMAEYGENVTPFNKYPNVPSYVDEMDKTKNPHRLAFVRKELGL